MVDQPLPFLQPDRGKRLVLLATLFCLMLFGFVLHASNLTGWKIDDDEGAYLYTAWQMEQGQRLYMDLPCSKPPLTFFLGAALFKATGPSLLAARGLMAFLVCVSALFVFMLGRQLWDNAIGLTAAFIYLISPLVVAFGSHFRPDNLFILFQIAGMWLLVTGLQRQRNLPLGGAGLLFFLSFCSKLNALGVFACCLAFAALYLAFHEKHRGLARFKPLIWLGLGFCTPLCTVLIIAFFRMPDVFNQTVMHHLLQGDHASLAFRVQKGLGLMGAFFGEHWLLMIPALAIAVFYFLRRSGLKCLPGFILLLALAMLLMGRNLYFRHFLFAAPTLSLYGAVFIVCVSRALKRASWLAATAMLVVLAVFFSNPIQCKLISHENGTDALVSAITSLTGAQDRIFGDYAMLNFLSERQGIPQTSYLSRGAASTGQITAKGLIEEIQRQNVVLIALHVQGFQDGRYNLQPACPPPHHLYSLKEYDWLKTWLVENYRFLGSYERAAQTFHLFGKSPTPSQSNFSQDYFAAAGITDFPVTLSGNSPQKNFALGQGWAPWTFPLQDQGRTESGLITEGEKSTIFLWSHAQKPLLVKIRARRHPSGFTKDSPCLVLANGQKIGVIHWPNNTQSFSFTVPPKNIKPGLNQILFLQKTPDRQFFIPAKGGLKPRHWAIVEALQIQPAMSGP